MERSDFDRLIKHKLSGENTAHSKEIREAKPFVWASVHNNLAKKATLRWYHLAAAILLLLISFTFLLKGVQKNHSEEISRLAAKLDQLEEDFQSQEQQLIVKEQQVSEMADEIRMVEIRLASINQEAPKISKEVVVYRTDTVYLKQTEYVSVTDHVPDANPASAQVIQTSVEEKSTQAFDTKLDEVIYPSLAQSRNQQKSESVKVKFGNTRTIRN